MDLEVAELQLITEKGDVVDFDISPYEEAEDPNVKAHLIRGAENDELWLEGMSAQDVVDTARLLGVEVVALCGYKWVPKFDPAKHDICSQCIKIWESLA